MSREGASANLGECTTRWIDRQYGDIERQGIHDVDEFAAGIDPRSNGFLSPDDEWSAHGGQGAVRGIDPVGRYGPRVGTGYEDESPLGIHRDGSGSVACSDTPANELAQRAARCVDRVDRNVV